MKKYKAIINYNSQKDNYELRFLIYYYDSHGNFKYKKSLWINDDKFNLNIMAENSLIPCIDLDAFTYNGKILSRKL